MMDSRWLRNSFIYLLVLVAVMAVFFTLFQQPAAGKMVDISQVMTMARNGEIAKIEVQGQGDTLSITPTSGAEKLRTAIGKRYGLETMCVGGGQGMAMIVERLS